MSLAFKTAREYSAVATHKLNHMVNHLGILGLYQKTLHDTWLISEKNKKCFFNNGINY